MITADELAASNIIYRHPVLAERVRLAAGVDPARRWSALIDQHHPHARSVADFGCWTGMDVQTLSQRYQTVGVDIQPHLIDYARAHRRGPEFVVGDVRLVRLQRQFDVLLCVGNTLSYLHTDADLDAAFATFTTHARRDCLLIVQTLLAPIGDPQARLPCRFVVDGFAASYSDRTEWSALTYLMTTHRTWVHDDGRVEQDCLRQRVVPAPELALRATHSGWEVLTIDFDPPRIARSATGAMGCLVARFRGPLRQA